MNVHAAGTMPISAKSVVSQSTRTHSNRSKAQQRSSTTGTRVLHNNHLGREVHKDVPEDRPFEGNRATVRQRGRLVEHHVSRYHRNVLTDSCGQHHAWSARVADAQMRCTRGQQEQRFRIPAVVARIRRGVMVVPLWLMTSRSQSSSSPSWSKLRMADMICVVIMSICVRSSLPR